MKGLVSASQSLTNNTCESKILFKYYISKEGHYGRIL